MKNFLLSTLLTVSVSTALGACSGDPPNPATPIADAGTADARIERAPSDAQAPAPKMAFVSALTDYRTPSLQLYANITGGVEAPRPGCTQIAVGGCSGFVCAADAGVPEVTKRPSAGRIDFEITAQRETLKGFIEPAPATGIYAGTTVTAAAALGGGESLLVRTAGGDVPAFEGRVAFPLVLLMADESWFSSAAKTVPRTEDLVLQVQRGGPSTELSLALSGKSAQLSCILPTDTGEARIVKSVLGQLPPGAYQTQALTAQRSDATAGDFAVRVYAVGPVYNTAKTQAFAASIQLQ